MTNQPNNGNGKGLDRLISLLGPLGATVIMMFWVGNYKGQTDAKLASHDTSISAVTTLVAIDHDKTTTLMQVVSDMSKKLDDLHNYFAAQGSFGSHQQSNATVPADTAAIPLPAAALPATAAPASPAK
jgi:hypothetical protein